MNMNRTITFPKQPQSEFSKILRQRVRAYFKDNNISMYSDYRMVIKSMVMLSLYFGPYFLMVFGVVQGTLPILLMWVVMGFGVSGIGLSIMHDANHGAYSKNPKVNEVIGYILNVIGGNAINWKIQHNVLHHSYTNIADMDEDINPGNVLRLHPHDKLLPHHKYQHIYAWFVYTLMTLMWLTTKDFKQLFRYRRKDLMRLQKRSFSFRMSELIISKILYFTYILVVPLVFIPTPWWVIILGFLLMQLLGGLILASIFQPAHVVPDTEFPLPNEEGKMENHWTIHQLMTTCNFAPKSPIFSWFVGGLNFQIEHHLFPNVCHIHYKKLSKIVKQTAKEFSLPYYSQPSFIQALVQHGKMLYRLGRV